MSITTHSELIPITNFTRGIKKLGCPIPMQNLSNMVPELLSSVNRRGVDFPTNEHYDLPGRHSPREVELPYLLGRDQLLNRGDNLRENTGPKKVQIPRRHPKVEVDP